MNQPPTTPRLPDDRDIEQRASRVAMIGIIAGLVLTAAGMMIRSPVLGGLGLVGLMLIVIFRKPLARVLPLR